MKKLVFIVSILVASGAGAAYHYWPSTKGYFESGKKYFDEKKYVEASIQFTNALTEKPTNRDARYFLALCLLNLQDAQRATVHLRALLDTFPNDIPANLQLANIYLAEGSTEPEQFKEARRIAEKILTIDPQNVDALILSGSASLGLDNYGAAAVFFEKAVNVDPRNVYAFIKLGSTRMLQKRYADAEESLLKAREIDPTSKGALAALTTFYRVTGDSKRAESLVQEGLLLDSDHKGVQLLAVDFFDRQGRFEEAEKILRNAQEKVPSDPSPSLLLVDLYAAKGRAKDALDLIVATKQKFPQNVDVAGKMAATLIATDPGRARTEIDIIRKLEPNNPLGYVLLGELQYRTGQYDAAQATLGTNPALDSPYPAPHFLLGNLARRQGKLDDAISHYQKSISVIKGGYTPARMALAEAFLEKGKIADAREQTRKVLESQPQHVQALLFKAALDTLERRFSEAEQTLTALVKLQPQNPDVLRQMAVYQATRGSTADAKKNLARALELRPDSLELLREITILDVQDNQIDKAIQRLNAVPDSQKTAFHYELLGSVYSRAGKSDEAERAYKKALEKDPSRANSDLFLFREYRRKGRTTDGLQALDDLLKRNPLASNAHLLKGSIYRNQGDDEQAKHSYSEALRIQPDSDLAANNLAYILAQEGKDLDGALHYALTARKNRPEVAAFADTLGWVYYKRADYISAREQSLVAVARQPDNGTYLYHLAKSYQATYEIELALEALKRAVNSKKDFKERPLAEADLKELSK